MSLVMQKHVEIKFARAGLLSILLSLILLLGFRLSTGPGVPALEFPLIPIAFLALFIIGFMLGVVSFVRGTLKRRIIAAVLAYAIVGILSLGAIAVNDIANGTLSVNALGQQFTDIRFYSGLMLVCAIWPLFLVDVLGIFIIFHRI
jgi:hypothetical protein